MIGRNHDSSSETNIVIIVMIEWENLPYMYIYIIIYIYQMDWVFYTLPQKVLNTHMRAWLLLLLEKSKVK